MNEDSFGSNFDRIVSESGIAETPVVHVETETFSADAYEMYDMPADMVMDVLSAEGPEQLMMMTQMFSLALVDPRDADKLTVMSFNELSSAMFQWHKKSRIRMSSGIQTEVLSISKKGADGGAEGASSVSAEDTKEIIELVTEMLEELKGLESDTDAPSQKIDKPLNDPGDDVSPF